MRLAAQRWVEARGSARTERAVDERGEPPCDYVASAIERRLGEVNQRLRELRGFKRELTELRDRIRATGPASQRDGAYCHYIQAAAAEISAPQTTAASSP